MKQTMLTLLLFLASVLSFSQSVNNIPITTSRGFVENKGQIVNQFDVPNRDVLYMLYGNGLNVQLRKDGFSYDCLTVAGPKEALKTTDFHRIDVSFENANTPDILTTGESADYENFYLRGRETTHVRNFQSITYRSLYEGIDFEFKMNPAMPMGFEYLIHAAPGADISLVQLKYSGQFSLVLNDKSIELNTKHGKLTETIPASWTMPGRDVSEVFYVLREENTIGFQCNAIAPDLALVIDPSPQIVWATYYGGEDSDSQTTLSISDSGEIFLYGTTKSLSGIATNGTHQTSLAFHPNSLEVADIVLVKFDQSGQRIWGTYYGGGRGETQQSKPAILGDKICISGWTYSTTGIAFGNSYQSQFTGGSELLTGYIACFHADGTIHWSTYMGDGNFGMIRDIKADNGNLVFCGVSDTTSELGFNVSEGLFSNGGSEAILGSFSPDGDLLWCRYFGGLQSDAFSSLLIINGEYYLAGSSSSPGLASQGAHLESLTGFSNTFFARFNSEKQLEYFTYNEMLPTAAGIRLTEHDGNFYFNSSGGQTNLGLGEVHQTFYAGVDDMYIGKLSNQFEPVWFSYFGGSGIETYFDTAIIDDKIFMVGSTQSATSIATEDALQTQYAWGPGDGFLAIFSTQGQLLYGTYFGGSMLDRFHGVEWAEGHMFISGSSRSDGLASQGAFMEQNPGSLSIILIKFSLNTLIEELDHLNDVISVFPNPSSTGRVRLESEVEMFGWILVDNKGRRISQRNGLKSKSETIDTSALTPGIYHLQVISTDGDFVTKKMVIE